MRGNLGCVKRSHAKSLSWRGWLARTIDYAGMIQTQTKQDLPDVVHVAEVVSLMDTCQAATFSKPLADEVHILRGGKYIPAPLVKSSTGTLIL